MFLLLLLLLLLYSYVIPNECILFISDILVNDHQDEAEGILDTASSKATDDDILYISVLDHYFLISLPN